MKKLILVFNQNGYPENGGGLYIEYPKTPGAMDKRVNDLLNNGENGDKCTIVCAGALSEVYEYIAIEKVTVYERKEIKE